MKILMLNDSMVRGGRERRLIELLKGLAQYDDIECELLLLSDRVEYPEVYELGIPVHILERKPAKDPRIFYRLVKLCRQIKPDIIHSWAMMSSVYALAPRFLLRTKLINAGIADARKDMSFFYENYFRGRVTFPFSNVVLANSLAGLEAYRAPLGKRQYIHNGFDFGRVAQLENKEALRKRLGIRTPQVVGMVGGFFERKDYDTFIVGGCQLLENHPSLTLLAVGNGPDLERCRALVPEKLRDRFLFTGMEKQVESIMNVFDIGVLLTNTTVHQEGISNSILEYMALGKPVVATCGGGTNEIVVDGETGILIPSLNQQAFVAAIQNLLNNPGRRMELGKNGQLRIEQHFSLPKMTSKFRKLYDELMGGQVENRGN